MRYRIQTEKDMEVFLTTLLIGFTIAFVGCCMDWPVIKTIGIIVAAASLPAAIIVWYFETKRILKERFQEKRK